MQHSYSLAHLLTYVKISSLYNIGNVHVSIQMCRCRTIIDRVFIYLSIRRQYRELRLSRWTTIHLLKVVILTTLGNASVVHYTSLARLLPSMSKDRTMVHLKQRLPDHRDCSYWPVRDHTGHKLQMKSKNWRKWLRRLPLHHARPSASVTCMSLLRCYVGVMRSLRRIHSLLS